ncbi:MAG TPA: hypothetical protein VK808_01820, partial [Bacteroidia bacterium]|nr:hypothetical protein [Bacteroidia bacterium]
MKRTILSVCATYVLLATTLFTNTSQAQKTYPGDLIEKKFSCWSLTIEQVRVQVGADNKEYSIFKRFCRHTFDSVYIEFAQKMQDPMVGADAVKEYMAAKKPFFVNLFNAFRQTEKNYPTSVSEYKTEPRPRIGGDSCFSSCYNTNFEDGTFDGWYG